MPQPITPPPTWASRLPKLTQAIADRSHNGDWGRKQAEGAYVELQRMADQADMFRQNHEGTGPLTGSHGTGFRGRTSRAR